MTINLTTLSRRSRPTELPAAANLKFRKPTASTVRSLADGIGFLTGATLAAILISGFMDWVFFDGFMTSFRRNVQAELTLGFAVGAWPTSFALFTRIPSRKARPDAATTPLRSWKSDRRFQITRIACGSSVLGAAPALLFAMTADFVQLGLAFGFIIAVGGFLFTAFEGKHHAWLAYVPAIRRLSREGKLPRDLMYFLDDCHRLGLLRAVGPIYQFRHAALQDRLAEKYQRRPLTP